MLSSARTMALTALLLASASVAAAQDSLPPAPVGSPQPVNLAPEPLLQQPMAPVAPVNPAWGIEDARELLEYVDAIAEEGLDPADYGVTRLRAAVSAGEGPELDAIATQTFLKVSSDLALGHVRGDDRIDWHVNDPDLNGNQQYALMQKAIDRNSVRDSLTSLLPTHPQYAELKAVLAMTPESDTATRAKIRTNLDRWRWLPRDLGAKYVLVNVPAYTVALVEDGRVVARHRAVSGSVRTPTPQLNATIQGVILNPWWEIPASIEPEVRGKRGYVRVPNGNGGFRYRQPPGANNALGRMKLVMPNDHAIYLHDTPSKAHFDRNERALSHGCIRTQDALGFAATLLGPTGEWDRGRINEVVAEGKTTQANLAEPIPVYIAYFTAAAVKDKGGIVSYKDVYSRDGKVVQALNATRSSPALASAGGN